MTNILILSVGTRNKIVQYFKKNLQDDGYVIATDMSSLAPAIYEADKFYIVPTMNDPRYIDIILDICKKEKIKGVLSLIDPELALIAKYSDKFKEIGVTVIGSSKKLCDISLDKLEMYNWLNSHKYLCAKTFDNIDEFFEAVSKKEIDFPVFVKPRYGSASLSISRVEDAETLEVLYRHSENLIIQEYLKGQEIGADVYIDLLTGEVVSIFTKRKIKMRAGETDKSVSFKNKQLFLLIEKFVKEMGYRGQIDIDIFEINGKYYISEVNPRFGGGYPHAYEAGVNHMALILNNLRGVCNSKNIGEYDEEIYMMKYNDIYIRRNI